VNWEPMYGNGFRACVDNLVAVVVLDGPIWLARVAWHGELVHKSEHESRDDAMAYAQNAVYRARNIRRFES
jgi:hypothetical protein